MKKLAALALSGALISTAAFAGTTSGNFNINATVNDNCVITDLQDVTTSYDPLATNNKVVDHSVEFKCTRTTTYTVSSPHTIQNKGTLTGSSHGDQLEFYIDFTQDNDYTGTGAGPNNTLTTNFDIVFPAEQDVQPDSYSGQATIEITFQ